jgi:hypothetical protein
MTIVSLKGGLKMVTAFKKWKWYGFGLWLLFEMVTFPVFFIGTIIFVIYKVFIRNYDDLTKDGDIQFCIKIEGDLIKFLDKYCSKN